MPPAECDREIVAYEQRRQEHGEQYPLKPIDGRHTLLRCVPLEHVDYEADLPTPSAFGQAGMSVYVQGPGFNEVDLDEILTIRPQWVAIASIGASEFIENKSFYGFDIYHDPFPAAGCQHDNHAIVVCKKIPTKGSKIKAASIWAKRPPAKSTNDG